MNLYEYLQSRFVASQIELNKKKTTSGHAENHAILAWMWVALKISTAFYLLTLLAHYFAVLLHVVKAPKQARLIAADEARRQLQVQEAAKKFAEDEAQKNKALANEVTNSVMRTS